MVIPSGAKALAAVLRPEVIVRAALKRFHLGSLEFRLAFDAFERPWYAHGVYEAARLAVRLGEPAITVMEFGVASGNGLIAMETVAEEVSRRTGVRIDVFGFDNGEGLPTQSDYRDLPCVWRKGLYKMDVAAVQARLRSARLVIGDVTATVPDFLAERRFPPIGFISFDVDYYTSTTAALRIFDGPDSAYLPRVFSYFDDIISGDQQFYCEDVGELLAIHEFNTNARRNHRLRSIYGWRRSHLLQPEWADAMWLYHRFDHARYDDYIGGDAARRARASVAAAK